MQAGARRLLLVCGVLATALIGAGPAPAQDEEPPPEYFTKKYFFQCQGDLKVQNVEGRYGWTEIPPTRSYQTGAGCGWLDSGQNGEGSGDPRFDAIFGGTHDGAVKAINVELHDLLLTQRSTRLGGGTVSFHVVLEVDGEVLVNTREGAPAQAIPVVSPTGLTQKVEFSLAGFELPVGPHDYRLSIMQAYLDTNAAWVFDATEIPAHVQFNPVTLKPTRIH